MLQEPPITYLGWSGFCIELTPHQTILIDPPSRTAAPNTEAATILITHGHPDHVSGTQELLEAELPNPLTIVGSRELIAWLKKRYAKSNAIFHDVVPGQRLKINVDLTLTAISWNHMGHIPPEPGNAAKHISGFLRHPMKALGIAGNALFGAPWAPMIGFCIESNGAGSLLFYGEGIHRKTDLEDVQNNVQIHKPLRTFFAVEPEDLNCLACISAKARLDSVYIYEAHAAWRSDLGIGNVDLDQLAVDLTETGLDVRIP